MKTETTIQGLAASLNPARAARKIIGFVPTMEIYMKATSLLFVKRKVM